MPDGRVMEGGVLISAVIATSSPSLSIRLNTQLTLSITLGVIFNAIAHTARLYLGVYRSLV